jgi:N-acetylmuramoyl-L-alanine amidase
LPSSTAKGPTERLAGRTIVIDPGHNEGNSAHAAEINQLVDVITRRKPCDTSGTATNGGYSEASFNTDIARRLTELLRDEGAEVILTRGPNTPWGPCITERAAIGNRAHADAAISIHADGGPAAGRGFHVIEPRLIRDHNDAIVGPSHRLALLVRDAFRDGTSMPTSNYLGRDGIDARDDLGGLNLSTVDKVFLECGNMRNNTDAALLSDPNWRQRAAAAIAAGLVAFLR